MDIILGRIKLFVKELLNFLTDILVPLLDLVIAIATILPIPTKWLLALHAVEKFLKEAGAKLEDVIELIKNKK